MNVELVPVEERIETRNDGRRTRVVGEHKLNGVVIGQAVEMIPETDKELSDRMARIGTVFTCDRGIGIAGGHLYLYPNGEIHNGCLECGEDGWKFSSEEEANNFLEDFKNKIN